MDLHPAFSLDSLESSHPINIPVGHPDEIREIFDTISYLKGQYLTIYESLFLILLFQIKINKNYSRWLFFLIDDVNLFIKNVF